MSDSKKGLDALLKESFLFYIKNILSFLKVILVVFIPFVVLDHSFLLRISFRDIPYSLLSGNPVYVGESVISVRMFLLIIGLIGLGLVFAFFILQLALLKTILAAEEGRKESVWSIYKSSWRDLRDYLWVLVLVFWFCSLWALLLIVPGAFMSLLYSLTIVAFVVDGKRGKDALLYSRTIVAENILDYLLYVGGMVCVVFLFCGVFVYLLELLFRVHATCAYIARSVIGEILQDFSVFLVGSFPLVFIYMIYQEFKRRHDSISH